MTAILGYSDGTNVWIGGDSASLNGWTRYTLGGRKVFSLFGDMLFGFAGEPRLAQIVRYGLAGSVHLQRKRGASAEEWLVMGFMPAVLEACETHKFDWHAEDNNNAAFLLGYHGVLYSVSQSGQVEPVGNGLAGLGAGAEYAMGAFHAFHYLDPDIERVMIGALGVSAMYSGAVLPPFYVEKL